MPRLNPREDLPTYPRPRVGLLEGARIRLRQELGPLPLPGRVRSVFSLYTDRELSDAITELLEVTA